MTRSRISILGLMLAVGSGWIASAQDEPKRRAAIQIDMPSPIAGRDAEQLRNRLTQLATATGRADIDGAARTTVVLRFGSANNTANQADPGDGRITSFENAFAVARLLSGRDLRRLRFVAWLDGSVPSSDVLPVLGCEAIVVSPDATIGMMSDSEMVDDETIALNYDAIAKRRGLFPPEVVRALADSTVELARVRTLDGETQYATGQTLDRLRASGSIASETIWSASGEPLVLDADQLRQLSAAMAMVRSAGDVADVLRVAGLQPDEMAPKGPAQGRLLSVTGVIGGQRVRRWTSNLAATVESDDANTWLIRLDSSGGNLNASVSMAAMLADPGPSIQTVGGFVSGEARGDAAIIAAATRPLLMAPEATLGGAGDDAMSPEDVASQRELIRVIASATNRSETLLRGLLDPTLPIYSFTNRSSGRLRYATLDELSDELGDVPVDDVWQRRERIDLSEPISPARAVALGLADGEASTLSTAAAAIGLNEVPEALSDRGLVRWVEQIGRSDALAFVLLLVGFMMLSTELSAPGLGIPGFVAMLCFAFFFWTKFLAGTAEWLELLAFGLGIACLLIEVFVLPGFGVFGLGGMVLTVLGVVLMSQTFVIPRNSYQINELVRGISIAITSLGGVILGLLAVRTFLPQAAVAAGLSMGRPDAVIDEQERVAKFDDLIGTTGMSVTPLRPSGKARFGDRIVGVISDATAIESGQSIRVLDVQGNRIIVEAADASAGESV
ncbi:MAG: NfeD family protein [Planctomycetota bacterium]